MKGRHCVRVGPFGIDPHAVSNQRFAEFVEATGYVTEAERYGWSFVFGWLLPDQFPPTRAAVHAPWWRQVDGADWGHPEGPHSDVSGRADHPVVHVSFHDAVAFCGWTGTRLLTEAEWCADWFGRDHYAISPRDDPQGQTAARTE